MDIDSQYLFHHLTREHFCELYGPGVHIIEKPCSSRFSPDDHFLLDPPLCPRVIVCPSRMPHLRSWKD